MTQGDEQLGEHHVVDPTPAVDASSGYYDEESSSSDKKLVSVTLSFVTRCQCYIVVCKNFSHCLVTEEVLCL